jgi:hypothetical protein
MQLNFATGAVLCGVNNTAVEWARVDVEADGALVEVARIEDAMHGLKGIDGAGMRRVHLDGVSRLDFAFAEGKILVKHAKILDQQTADGDGHPTVLVFVIVHGAGLADLPTNGDQLIKRSFIDQVTGVVLAIPGEIGSERLGMNRRVLEERAKLLNLVEGRVGQLAEFGDEGVDGGLFRGNGHRGAPGKSITQRDRSIQVGQKDLKHSGTRRCTGGFLVGSEMFDDEQYSICVIG